MEGARPIEVKCEGALTARAHLADDRISVVAQAAFSLEPGHEMEVAAPPALGDADVSAVAAEGVRVRVVGQSPVAIYTADGRPLWSSADPSAVLTTLKGDEWVVVGAAETGARSKLPTVWAVARPAGARALPEVVLRCCALTIDMPASRCTLRWHGSVAAEPDSASVCVTMSTRLAPVAAVGRAAPAVQGSFESTQVMTDEQHAAVQACEQPAPPADIGRADESPLAATVGLEEHEVVEHSAPFELAAPAGTKKAGPRVFPGAPWEKSSVPRKVLPPGPFESTVLGSVEVGPELEQAADEPPSGPSPEEVAAAARAREEAEASERARQLALAAAEERAKQEALEAERVRREEEEAAKATRLAEERRAEADERFRREQEEALRAEAKRREEEERRKQQQAKQLRTDMYGAFKRRK